jgi:hypothetical protein
MEDLRHAHEAGTEHALFVGVLLGTVALCDCPNHTLVRELQLEAITARN